MESYVVPTWRRISSIREGTSRRRISYARLSRPRLHALWARETPTADDSAVRWNDPVRQAQTGLELIAEASGGFAITDTDDLPAAWSGCSTICDHYYLLGFHPSDPSGKDYRPIDVKVVGHPDWVLRFRKRYLGDGPPSLPRARIRYLAGVMPKTNLPLRLLATPLPSSPTPGKLARIALALEVTAPVIGLQQADGSLQDDVTYQVLAIDEKKAKAASREGHAAKLVLRPRVARVRRPRTCPTRSTRRWICRPAGTSSVRPPRARS